MIHNIRKRNTGGEVFKRRSYKPRQKLGEGIYSSVLLYAKFIMVWSAVACLDHLLDFRLEYLCPFWFLVTSLSDSFKYQGLMFSLLFLVVAIISDVICYLVVPVQLLFFAATTYVWAQYLWYTGIAERGVCVPTVALCALIVWVEASFRLRDLKSIPSHLDLCRPFAAHCIGYPVVSLGFGFKTLVSYKIRARKQRDIQRENEFYYQVLLDALPEETRALNHPGPSVANGSAVKSQDDADYTTDGIEQLPTDMHHLTDSHRSASSLWSLCAWLFTSVTHCISSASSSGHYDGDSSSRRDAQNEDSDDADDRGSQSSEASSIQHTDTHRQSRANRSGEDWNPGSNGVILNGGLNANNNATAASRHTPSGSFTALCGGTDSGPVDADHSADSHTMRKALRDSTPSSGSEGRARAETDRTCNADRLANRPPVDRLQRLEAEVKKLRSEASISRNETLHIRASLSSAQTDIARTRGDLQRQHAENDDLRNKISAFQTQRAESKQSVTRLERQLENEKKSRGKFEQELNSERKARKSSEQELQKALQTIESTKTGNAQRGDCGSSECKERRVKSDVELAKLRQEVEEYTDRLARMNNEAIKLQQSRDTLSSESEVLLAALQVMQEKNAHLEQSLSAENRLKMDLLGALSDNKRKLDMAHAQMRQQQLEQLGAAHRSSTSPTAFADSQYGGAFIDGPISAPYGYMNGNVAHTAISGTPNGHVESGHSDLSGAPLSELDFPALQTSSK